MIIKCIDSTNLINSSESGSCWEETHKTREMISILMELKYQWTFRIKSMRLEIYVFNFKINKI